MGLFDAVGAADVLSAIGEFDRLGGKEFLTRYGFGSDHDYVLWHDGRIYDTTAILGVARQFASGSPATQDQFSDFGAAKLLMELGFYVTSTDPYGGFGSPASGTWQEAAGLSAEETADAWATAARDVLLQAAHRYRAVVTEEDLATQVIYRTGIRDDVPAADWASDVLRRVAADCASRGEPILAALCVTAAGRAADGYADAVLATAGARPSDTEDHAAQQRLACYRHFHAAGLPADGGTAARAARVSTPRAPRAPKAPPTPRAARAAAVARPTLTCPTCFMTLPATGICDDCS